MGMRRYSLLVLFVALAGCPDRTISAVTTSQNKVETKDIPTQRRGADILFLIDNSGSMKEEQDSLRANFGKMMQVLETLDGGMPDVHIGVATSDLGTSTEDGTSDGSKFGCTTTGDDGQLRTAPVITGRYIADDGHGNKNYTGTLDDAFSALADVGIIGCGIEQHLHGMERALQNPVNTGFVRTDAYLGVVVIADEDDCSLAHQGLFASSSVADSVNFACTSDGVECDEPDMTTPGMRTNCHASDHARWVQSTDHFATFLKTQKADPRDVVVAGILGNPAPLAITMKNNVSVLAPSCTYAGPTGDQTAFPAVRTTDFLAQFESRTSSTICGADLQQGMTQIGALLKGRFGDPCFEDQVVDVDPSTPELDPECSVSEVKRVSGGEDVELDLISACKQTAGAPPCWRIEEDAVNCSYTHTDPHLKLVIDRGGEVVDPAIHVRASCVTVDPSGSQF
jgi:hypothetical protein